MELHLERGSVPWEDFEMDTPLKPVVASESGGLVPPVLQSFATSQGQPIVFLDREPRIRESIFKDLKRVDGTRLAGREIIGTLSGGGLDLQPMQRWVLYLLVAEVIKTYAHIESHLCLSRESDTNERYLAQFSGKHIYYTNQRNEARLAFAITIEKATGQIVLEPERSSP